MSIIYSVSYRTEPCRLNTDTFILSYPAGTLPQLQITPSSSNASNGSTEALTFAGDSTTYHYIWCNSSNDTLSVTDSLINKPSGYYHVDISTIDCDTTLSFLIPEEHYNLSFVSPEIVCSNAPITFENTSDSYYTQFLWHFNANDIATVSDPVYAYTSAGTFETMLIGRGLRCSDTTYKHIIVDAPVVGNFVADPKESCMGETIKFTMIPDSTSIKHNWSFGDETGFVDLPSFAVQHAYDRAGVMPVTITSQFRSCPDVTYTDTIVVYEMPKVDLGADSLLCLDGEALTLNNKQPPSATCHYLWNTGETTPTLHVVHPCTYSLTVSNEPLGCSTTESVVVNKDCYIDIPNAFSPNGDGVNDYFLPRQMVASGLVAFSMQIFNRWGQ